MSKASPDDVARPWCCRPYQDASPTTGLPGAGGVSLGPAGRLVAAQPTASVLRPSTRLSLSRAAALARRGGTLGSGLPYGPKLLLTPQHVGSDHPGSPAARRRDLAGRRLRGGIRDRATESAQDTEGHLERSVQDRAERAAGTVARMAERALVRGRARPGGCAVPDQCHRENRCADVPHTFSSSACAPAHRREG